MCEPVSYVLYPFQLIEVKRNCNLLITFTRKRNDPTANLVSLCILSHPISGVLLTHASPANISLDGSSGAFFMLRRNLQEIMAQIQVLNATFRVQSR